MNELYAEFPKSLNHWNNFLQVLRAYHFLYCMTLPSFNSVLFFSDWNWHVEQLGKFNELTNYPQE